MAYKIKSAKHYPRPEYCRCNAGHQLYEVYDEKHNRFDWDCPICKAKMERAGRKWATRLHEKVALSKQPNSELSETSKPFVASNIQELKRTGCISLRNKDFRITKSL